MTIKAWRNLFFIACASILWFTFLTMCDRKDKDEFNPFENYSPPITFGAGQVVVDGVKPRTFAAETTPEDTDEFYSQAGGNEEKVTIATLKQTFGPEITSSVGYVPSASANANNRNEFVIDPNGARWFIDFDGDAIQFAAGGASSWTTLADIPAGFADDTDNVNDADASTTNETITSLTYNPATGAYQIVEAGTTRTLTLGKTIACSDEGTPLTSNLKGINFVGAGVTVTEPTADSLIVTIPGGAGGSYNFQTLTQGTLTANTTSFGASATPISISGTAASGRTLVVAASNTLRSFYVEGTGNIDINESQEFVLIIDNSANSRPAFFKAEVYSVVAGRDALQDQFGVNINHTQEPSTNTVTFTFPNMNLFGSGRFRILFTAI